MTLRSRALPGRTARTLAAGLCAVLLSGLMTGFTSPHESRPKPPKPLAEHVVFLGLDGFDIDYLDDAPMPNLRRLLRRGSLTTSTGVMTSITNPSWASVATGAWPQRHRNTAYWYDAAAGVARGQQRELAVPTIAQAIRARGGTVMSAQWFILQNYGTAYGD